MNLSYFKRKIRMWHLIYSVYFLILLVSFTFVGVSSLKIVGNTKNLIEDYYLSQNSFLYHTQSFFIFILLVCGISIFALHKDTLKHKHIKHWISPLLESIGIMLGLLVLSFNLALLSLFAVALGQISYLSNQLKNNPQQLGITWGTSAITQQLNNLTTAPQIVITDYNNLNKTVFAEEIAHNDKNSFYVKKIIYSLPSSITTSFTMPNQSLVMVNNTLFITKLDKDAVEGISARLGYLFVNDYFSPRYIKPSPSINVLGRQDFMKMREDQINLALNQINTYENAAQTVLDNDNAAVSTDQSKIVYNQQGFSSSVSSKNNAISNCEGMGYYDYFLSTYIRSYSDAYCQLSASSWDSIIAGWQKNINDWNYQLGNDQYQLKQDQDVKDYLDTLQTIIANQKDSTPAELGIFHNQNQIDIALDFVNSKSVPVYLETLTHEYMHYTSFVSKDKTLPSFFEEGFTEYYARKIISKELGLKLNIGYPLYEIIINQMMKKLSETEVRDVYFTKDQTGLQDILNTAYGSKFYDKNSLNFIVLPFLGEDKALGVANDIMKQIGGKTITKDDLVSDMPIVN